MRSWFVFTLLLISAPLMRAHAATLVDFNATPETVQLANQLRQSATKGFLFGQQNATTEGMGWTDQGTQFCGDICKATGLHPAVYGWDFSDIFGKGDAVYASYLAKMRQVHDAGGINTMSWHMQNPVSNGGFKDLTPACSRILPGGDHNAVFLSWIDNFAGFLNRLTDANGKPIPVIFRPYHEQNADWFWWGSQGCEHDQFVALWKMTAQRLFQNNVHQLIYAFSPNWLPTALMDTYPGDDAVDIIGLDFYFFKLIALPEREMFKLQLKNLVSTARNKGKIAALTETGYEGIPDATWWTDIYLDTLKSEGIAGGLAYTMIWRNENSSDFYGPYPGQASVPDFVKMAHDPASLFLEKLH
jgi:mannan endo-1,4-beta-mannosidase